MKFWITIFAVLWCAACVSDPPAAGPAPMNDGGVSDAGATDAGQQDSGVLDGGGADSSVDVGDDAGCECPPEGGPENSTGVCDAAGDCQYTCNQGFFECSGGCVEPQTDVTACGICPVVDCSDSVPAGTMVSCEVGAADAPECVLGCPDGFQDENELLTDGCECPTGAVDFRASVLPLGCTRVVNSIVYVDPGAASAGNGLSPDSPLTLLSDAVIIARGQGRSVILVKSGTLATDNLSIDGSNGPLSIFGGRGSEWGATANDTTLPALDVNSPTLELSNFGGTDTLVLHNFTVTQGVASQGPSVTVRISNTSADGLEFGNVVVEGGDGAPGAVPQTAADGDHGSAGAPGTPGRSGVGSGLGGGVGGGSSCGAFGGNGGDSVVPSGCSSGTGAGKGENGESGQSPSGVMMIGGTGGDNYCVLSAEPSSVNGTNGAGNMSNPSVEPEHGSADDSKVGAFNSDGTAWSRDPGGDGLSGAHGIGGGGGGAGGSAVEKSLPPVSYVAGSSGGGGGGGGCGGSGGVGGGAGGDSVAILIVDSAVDLSGLSIVRGDGGDGAAGADGGCGGAGGLGGQGQAPSGGGGGVSGNGGQGTPGLGGSGGAGGNGGSSVGVGILRGSIATEADSYSGGTPGSAGTGGQRGGVAQFIGGGITTCIAGSGDPADPGLPGDLFDDHTFSP